MFDHQQYIYIYPVYGCHIPKNPPIMHRRSLVDIYGGTKYDLIKESTSALYTLLFSSVPFTIYCPLVTQTLFIQVREHPCPSNPSKGSIIEPVRVWVYIWVFIRGCLRYRVLYIHALSHESPCRLCICKNGTWMFKTFSVILRTFILVLHLRDRRWENLRVHVPTLGSTV